MRQAANALLAAPVSHAARVSAVMRRSTPARVSLALGLSFVLGVGVLGAGQPATAIATHPAIGPWSQSVRHDASTDATVQAHHRLRHADGPCVRRRCAQGATSQVRELDSTGTILTVSPRGHWSVATSNTVTVLAGAPTSSGASRAASVTVS